MVLGLIVFTNFVSDNGIEAPAANDTGLCGAVVEEETVLWRSQSSLSVSGGAYKEEPLTRNKGEWVQTRREEM